MSNTMSDEVVGYFKINGSHNKQGVKAIAGKNYFWAFGDFIQ